MRASLPWTALAVVVAFRPCGSDRDDSAAEWTPRDAEEIAALQHRVARFPKVEKPLVQGITAQRLRRLVEGYAAVAPTRLTGTPADEATSEWVMEELRAESPAGLEVFDQRYAIPAGQIWEPRGGGGPGAGYGCHLAVDGAALPCYVVQAPPAALTEVVDVPMERVLVLRMSGYEIESASALLDRHLNANGVLPYDAAIVINTEGSGPLSAIMGNNVTQPRPFDWQYAHAGPAAVPVVTVSYGFEATLRSARRLTSLALEGTWISSPRSRNVIAVMKQAVPPGISEGCEPALGPPSPIYIGTPINGFFRCAGERGAGVALLLALAQDLSRRPVRCESQRKRRCMMPVFGFSSGHDMGDPGITEGILPYLRQLAADANISMAEVPYVSIGANLANHKFVGKNFEGRAVGTQRVVMQQFSNGTAPTPALLAFVERLCQGSGSGILCMPSDATPPIGAARSAVAQGMSVINLASSIGGRFHLPADADASSVDLPRLRDAARAASDALRAALCASPGAA